MTTHSYLVVFALAFAVALAATPVVRRVAHRTGMTDQPAERKVHTEPMPLLGGLAIYLAVLAAVLALSPPDFITQLAGILTGATLMALLGFWDDRAPLRPAVKLGGQVLAGLVLVASGVRISLTGSPELDTVLTLAWVLAVTNAINFIDNMDGLSGGVAGIAAAYFLLLAVMNQQWLVAPLAAAVAGACIGFLVYNYNPASIFMGDGGTLFLGFLLAAIGIKVVIRAQPTTISWLVPVLVLAVPLFDLVLVVISRIRRRVNPFTTAGKDHLSHRLVRRGATAREAALITYLLGCAAGSLAVLVSVATWVEALAIAVSLLVLATWALWRLELSQPRPA